MYSLKPRTERRRVEDETKRFGKEYQGYVYIRRDDYAGKAVKVEDLSKPLGTRSMSRIQGTLKGDRYSKTRD